MDNPRPVSSPPDGTDSLRVDRFLDLLSNRRRRYVITHLQAVEDSVALADLARRIAEREHGQSAAPDSQSPDDVLVSLYHCHVPKLVDAGVVTHDRDRNTVEPADNFDRVRALMDAWLEHAEPDQGR